MRKLATTGPIDIGEPFTEVTVFRDNTWVVHAGKEIYVLANPEGDRYVMQSYSQIVDTELQESDLLYLADQMDLPAGWVFEVKTLKEELLIDAKNGAAIVLQILSEIPIRSFSIEGDTHVRKMVTVFLFDEFDERRSKTTLNDSVAD